jgi:hypothetical protein
MKVETIIEELLKIKQDYPALSNDEILKILNLKIQQERNIILGGKK